MSLINDALKRARQSQPPHPPPAGGPPLLPVESRPSGRLAWTLAVGIVLLVAVACFLIGLATASRTRPPRPAVVAAVPPAVVKNPVPAPAVAPPASSPAPALPATPPSQSPPAPAPAANGTLPPVVSQTNAAIASNATGAVAPPPGPRLQGILFDPAAPRAIVNGKNVRVGDRVGRFRVKAILNSAVTLEAADGTVTNLKLGD
ncbi:MAG: hypothetical protein KGJ60_05345 [Verrucomicrobiota bacterium]|nr:hypothetical protein [Verrucomicrobiota bacterium]